MITGEIKDKIEKSTNAREKYAKDNITPCPGRSVYYDSLDAVEICRKVLI